MSDRRPNNPLAAPLLSGRNNEVISKSGEVSALLGTNDNNYRLLPGTAPPTSSTSSDIRGIELDSNININRNNLALLPPPPPNNNNNNRMPNMGLGIAEVSYFYIHRLLKEIVLYIQQVHCTSLCHEIIIYDIFMKNRCNCTISL